MSDNNLSRLSSRAEDNTFSDGRPISLINQLERLHEIGIALSSVSDTQLLMEKILISAKEITHADGGTIYHRQDDELQFAIMINDSLNIHCGGSSGRQSNLPPVQLYKADGTANIHNVAAYAAVNRETVNIANTYQNDNFDFSGTRIFDEKMNYVSTSFLTVPIINHENRLISVLQLINAKNHCTNNIQTFSAEHQRLVESLASQAAIALSNKKLLEDQKKLFESFIEVIAIAIDHKSPYTAGHCRRVPELTLMLAEATINTDVGPMASFDMSEDDFYALKIAGWLHDCGKIITPEHVIDKATKLQSIHDRINEIDTRFEVLKRDAKIDHLEALQELNNHSDEQINTLINKYNARIAQLDSDRDFLRAANIGSEFITEEQKQRINQIGNYQWQSPDGSMRNLLSQNEIYNLHITKGTLTTEERQIINGHMTTTIQMLEALPYPDHLANVPEYAGGHHEKMDGTGYPRGLTREQMSVPARIMGIADIFEAVTAKDRPYRDGIKLSEALNLMGTFKLNNHIDPDLFDVFIREKVYLDYAKQFMSAEQIDEVDENNITGYQAS